MGGENASRHAPGEGGGENEDVGVRDDPHGVGQGTTQGAVFHAALLPGGDIGPWRQTAPIPFPIGTEHPDANQRHHYAFHFFSTANDGARTAMASSIGVAANELNYFLFISQHLLVICG